MNDPDIGMKRRSFVKKSGVLTVGSFIYPTLSFGSDQEQIEKWRLMMNDPVYQSFEKTPTLDHILSLFPKQQGPPAIALEEIKENQKKIRTIPEINTGHPYLDHSIMVALAHIDATFEGDHPKYGTGYYGRMEHDGFPPTIISAVDALTLWGLNERAAELFRYWITNFININGWPNPLKKEGEINYYGPSIAEYGQLLNTANLLYVRAGGENWWNDCFTQLDLMAEYILDLHANALKEDGLISGVPEADTRGDVEKYFHNNAWVAKGLKQWLKLCTTAKATPSTSLATVSASAEKLKTDTLRAIGKAWPEEPAAWWLPAFTGSHARPGNLTDGTEASYTNYRYWPELLSSDILPPELANRIVNARLNGGGQFCGMTRFMDWLDDWPLTDYLYGLWRIRT